MGRFRKCWDLCLYRKRINEEMVYKLGSQCFGLRKNMGECEEIKLVEEDKNEDLEDITIIYNYGDFNIFKGDRWIANTGFLV